MAKINQTSTRKASRLVKRELVEASKGMDPVVTSGSRVVRVWPPGFDFTEPPWMARYTAIKEGLRSDPRCSKAFHELCAFGCDPRALENRLLTAAVDELRRPGRRYRASEQRELESMTSTLRDLVHKLDKYQILLIIQLRILGRDASEAMKTSLIQLAENIDANKTRLSSFPKYTGNHRAAELARFVKESTGKPRRAQLSILVGLIFGRESFGPEDLKALELNKEKATGRRGKEAG